MRQSRKRQSRRKVPALSVSTKRSIRRDRRRRSCRFPLATNALKYAAWLAESGVVTIEWSVGPNRNLAFRWRERGGLNIAPPPFREGPCTTLIRRSLDGATVQHDLKADGLDCRIEIALA